MNEPMQPAIVADYERIAEDQVECDACFDEYPAGALSFPYDQALMADTGERWCERCQEDARAHEYRRRVTL